MVQVESHEILQAFECAFVDFLYLIKGHLQDLPQDDGEIQLQLVNIFGIIKTQRNVVTKYGNYFKMY